MPTAAATAARLGALSCACLLLAALGSVLALPSPAPAPAHALEPRQLASSADAAGDTVVYSVDPAGETTTIETIPAGAATTTALTSAAAGNAGVGGQGNEGQSVNLGQQASSPTGTSSTPPPTTYLAYTTQNGAQVTLTMTFVATTPTTPAPIQPMTGTVLPYTAYITNTATTTSGAKPKKFARQHGQVAAFGVLLSMLVGAIVVL